jgi:hypothetical protein
VMEPRRGLPSPSFQSRLLARPSPNAVLTGVLRLERLVILRLNRLG